MLNTSLQYGIFVAEDLNSGPTTAKIATAAIGASSTTAQVPFMQTWSTYIAGATNQGVLPDWGLGQGAYIGFGYDGTNFSSWFSHDGLSWERTASIAKTFTPVHAGIFALNSSGATAYMFFDFYRVKAATGAVGVGAGLFAGDRAT